MEALATLTALTLFGSVVWTIIISSIFIVILILADLYENGWTATGFFVVFCFLFIMWGNESWNEFVISFTWLNALLYFTIGLCHSFIRIYFFGRKKMKSFEADTYVHSNYEENKEAERKYIREKLKGNVFRWWFLWPISMVIWILKDMIKEVYDWMYQKLNKVFNFFLNLGMKSVPAIPQDKIRKVINNTPM